MHNSWEPVENLNAPEFVEGFHTKEPMAIRRIGLEQKRTELTTTPMPFHDFCKCPDSIDVVGNQLQAILLEPPPHSLVSCVSPLPDYGWTTINPTILGNATEDCMPSNALVNAKAPTPPPSNSESSTLLGSLAATEVNKVMKVDNLIHPGPPWFQWHDVPNLAPFIIDITGRSITLPFLCFREIME